MANQSDIDTAKVAEYLYLMKGLVDKGFEVMLFHQGLGETCIFSRLMKAYTEKTKKPLILITFSDARKAILEQCPDIYNVMSCDISFFPRWPPIRISETLYRSKIFSICIS